MRLLIAIFWTRLGTPTGESPSGTVEEIREHMRAGKPTAIYFSNAPVRLDSVDEVQYRALCEFREECRRAGLLEGYDSPDEFRMKFTRQLAQTVIRCFRPSGALGAAAVPTAEIATTSELSDDAAELLRAAVRDRDETSILLFKSAMKNGVIVGGRDFTEPGSPRSAARWIGALSELREAGLVADLSGKHVRFEVTHKGFKRADELG